MSPSPVLNSAAAVPSRIPTQDPFDAHEAARVVILAIACRFLLPSHTLLTFQFGGIAKGIGINRVAFWSVLVVGAVMFVVRFVRR